MPDHPKVSVNIITFNHAEFIAKALDSVLMQRTSFDYEIIIGDDCSNDGTREIIEAYHQSFPDKIKPLFRQKNVGMMRNVKETLEACTGEYIAFLEGDDYWTDAGKLQAQVDYLDQHPDCAVCHHKVDYVLSPGDRIVREFPPPRYRRALIGPRHLAMLNCIQTCSAMFRRKCLPTFDEEFQQLKLGDWPLFVLLNQHGWIGFIDRTMAHYRIHPNNGWNNRPPEYKLRAMEQMAWYLLERVKNDSMEFWQDMLLALTLKDIALTLKSFALLQSAGKLKQFIGRLIQFKKPFWMFNRLWPYLWSHYFSN
jgi:glycosyltransferase involved in cell wall biosynthesis